jgi:hypothetical protein
MPVREPRSFRLQVMLRLGRGCAAHQVRERDRRPVVGRGAQGLRIGRPRRHGTGEAPPGVIGDEIKKATKIDDLAIHDLRRSMSPSLGLLIEPVFRHPQPLSGLLHGQVPVRDRDGLRHGPLHQPRPSHRSNLFEAPEKAREGVRV